MRGIASFPLLSGCSQMAFKSQWIDHLKWGWIHGQRYCRVDLRVPPTLFNLSLSVGVFTRIGIRSVRGERSQVVDIDHIAGID